MKNTKRVLSVTLITAVILGCFIPFATTVVAKKSKKIVYTNRKGCATVILGQHKKKFYAKDYKYNNKNCFRRAVNEALKYAGKKATDKKKAKVVLSKGNYDLEKKAIHIFSNTELIAKGCRFRYFYTHLMVDFDNGRKSAKGYNGARNITITGGTWDAKIPYKNAFKIGKTKKKLGHCTFRFAHCKNIEVRYATFIDNYTNHDIELGGVNGADIHHCKFYNRRSVNKVSADGSESVQVDINHKTAMPRYPSYDYTPCKNIKIRSNVFKNKIRAVGSHHAVPGNLYDNIRVYNNKMVNIGRLAINGMYWANSRVYNNTLTNVGAGIDIMSFGNHNMYNEKKVSYKAIDTGLKKSKTYIYGNKVIIRQKNNTIKEFRCGVRARGMDCSTKKLHLKNKNVPNGIYKIYNAYIGINPKGKKAPNKVSGAFNSGTDIRYAVNSKMSYNSINMNKCYYENAYGLFVDHCINTTVSANRAVVSNKATKNMRSGATIRGGKSINFANNYLDVTDFGVQHLYGPTDVRIHDNDITSSRSSCVYFSGGTDDTPKVKKTLFITNNDLQSPDKGPENASIKIIEANIDITAYANGDITHWIRGYNSTEHLPSGMKELETLDLTIDEDDDNNYLKWNSSFDCQGYLVYRTVGSKKTLIADVSDKKYTDRYTASATYTVVPYAKVSKETVYGWPETEKVIKY